MRASRPPLVRYPFGTHERDARQALEDDGYTVLSLAVAREHGRCARGPVYVKGGDRSPCSGSSCPWTTVASGWGADAWLRNKVRALGQLLRAVANPMANPSDGEGVRCRIGDERRVDPGTAAPRRWQLNREATPQLGHGGRLGRL